MQSVIDSRKLLYLATVMNKELEQGGDAGCFATCTLEINGPVGERARETEIARARSSRNYADCIGERGRAARKIRIKCRVKLRRSPASR